VARIAHLQSSPGLEVPMSYPYSGMVVGGIYLLLVAVRRLGGGAWKVAA
jgi:TRAP-type C4-dicarboxylate transport system permease small subunit